MRARVKLAQGESKREQRVQRAKQDYAIGYKLMRVS
jgi:hypothetical protein